jgi:hypothetical protein
MGRQPGCGQEVVGRPGRRLGEDNDLRSVLGQECVGGVAAADEETVAGGVEVRGAENVPAIPYRVDRRSFDVTRTETTNLVRANRLG